MTTLPPEGADETTPQQAEDIANTGASQPPMAPDASGNIPPQPYAHDPSSQMPPQQGYVAPQQQQQPGYGAPQQGYAAPQQAADPLSNLTLNYWLSVFFIWIPALIFFIIEKDKGNPQIRALHAANLNFSLLRTGLFVVAWVLAFIPVLGPLLVGLAHIVLFVFHILAATKVTETFKRGGGDPFIFNIPLVK